MKSFTRGCLIFSGVAIAIGLVLTIIGGALGAGSTFASMLRDGRFSINGNNIVSVVDGKNTTDFTGEFEGIETLNIDLNYGELNIQKTDGDKYRVEAERVVRGFECREENGELIIEDNIKNNWRIGDEYHPLITLYIPENATLKEADIDMGAGVVNAERIEANTMDVDLGAGKFEADEIIAKEAELSVGAGQLTVEKIAADELNMDCGTGKMEVAGEIRGDANVECGIGTIKLTLNGEQSDYDYDIECGIGTIIVGTLTFGGVDGEKHIDNNSDYTMDINCGVGTIQISFENE
ncbi:DUF4097 family beta strand repeat-containing protein [Konateibacter massiliensis]|uniref:DUF4097 family beta strand repeat-containing protein n=1 Tax=Konateibacter massiliensis TaxID=2002841 RepID=UPI000C14CD27|nr:DUF4097 family beta strand repeat-containing protein [Konateibacter massiliensis]